MDMDTFVIVLVSVIIGWMCGRMMGYKEGVNDVTEWMGEINEVTHGAVQKAVEVWEKRANS